MHTEHSAPVILETASLLRNFFSYFIYRKSFAIRYAYNETFLFTFLQQRQTDKPKERFQRKLQLAVKLCSLKSILYAGLPNYIRQIYILCKISKFLSHFTSSLSFSLNCIYEIADIQRKIHDIFKTTNIFVVQL